MGARHRLHPPSVSAPSVAELVFARAERAPEDVYLVHGRTMHSVTFGELALTVESWIELLDRLGVGVGDRVGLLSADPLACALGFLGILGAGRIVAPLSPDLPSGALGDTCDHVGLSVVFADRPALAGSRVQSWVRTPGAGFAMPAPLARRPRRRLEDDQASCAGVALATSGTTGRAKVVELRERQLLHTAWSIASHHRLGADDVGFSPLPMWHINAEVVGLFATLCAGGRIVLDERFHRGGFWDQVGTHETTWINAVPAIVARLVPLRDGEAVPNSLRFVRSASAPLPTAVLRRFEDATGVPVIETYGMTEASSQITANPLVGRKLGSVGQPIGVELRVRAFEARGGAFRAASVGDAGDVEIRGAGVISSYAGGSHAERFDVDGWLSTGDIGSLDAEGFLTLLGRGDDLINRGGEKFYPREIEEVVFADATVQAVAVVGRSDEALGQVPVAYVVPSELASPDGTFEQLIERLEKRCFESLGRTRTPVEFHVVATLPTGVAGKIRRRELVTAPLADAVSAGR
jgi:oxalate---CoA ligase